MTQLSCVQDMSFKCACFWKTDNVLEQSKTFFKKNMTTLYLIPSGGGCFKSHEDTYIMSLVLESSSSKYS